MIVPNKWKNKKCSKPPTSIYIHISKKNKKKNLVVWFHSCLVHFGSKEMPFPSGIIISETENKSPLAAILLPEHQDLK
jgi:hypothetical protein